MSEKFKKIDREFCLGDSSVNVYGYRLLTSGFRQDLYEKNPIGFEMHEKGREKGVLVKWTDLRVDGDKIYGKPTINLYHPDGQKTVDEVENGFKNAASMGKIVCLDASDDPSLKINDQTGATVTEWYPREISFVDIPGNHNALAQSLFDSDDKELNLSDFVKQKNPNMSKVIVTAAMLLALDLSDNAPEAEVTRKFQDLVDTAGKVPGLEKDLADTKESLTAKETELKNLQDTTVIKQVQDLLDSGVTDGKITVETSLKLKETYAKNPTGLKDLLDVMPAQTKVTADKTGDFSDLAADVKGKTYHDLFVSGQLEEVKNNLPDLFEKLQKEASGNQSNK